MSKYLKLKRLVEADELQVTAPIGQVQSMDQFQAAQSAPAQPMEPAQTEAPQEEPLALPSGDVMAMTIGDFLMKADQINPLVKMGLETFINSHSDQLMQVETPQVEEPMQQDLTFSNAIEDQPAQDFDQPEDQLAFPQ